jgi:hypothetical protein
MPEALSPEVSAEFGGNGPSGFSGAGAVFFAVDEGLAGFEEAVLTAVPGTLDGDVCPDEICWAETGMAATSNQAPRQTHRRAGNVARTSLGQESKSFILADVVSTERFAGQPLIANNNYFLNMHKSFCPLENG